MNKLLIRTYTEQLESTIEKGVELRDSMRRKIDGLERIVHSQKHDINNANTAKELYRRRLDNYKIRLRTEREKCQKAEGKLEKQMNRYNEQDAFYAAIKAVAKEKGVWPELVAKAKESLNG